MMTFARGRTARFLSVLSILFLARIAFAAQPAIGPLSEVRIDERLGGQVPFDAVFRDATGAQRHLGDYFNHGRPVIVTLVYYECPMLCTLVLNGLVSSLKEMDLKIGEQFDIVTVSIDARETPQLAAQKRDVYFQQLNRPGAGSGWFWHVGEESEIKKLADALGFYYVYDTKSKEFAHQAAIFIITPEGKISRYLYGITFKPRDLKLGLLEAGREHIASTIDKIVLFCFHYDPMARGYSLYAWRLVQIAALFTLVVVGSALAYFWRRERRKMHEPHSKPPAAGIPSPG